MTCLTSAGKPKKNRRPRTAAPIVAWSAQQAFQDKEQPDRGGLIAFQPNSRGRGNGGEKEVRRVSWQKLLLKSMSGLKEAGGQSNMVIRECV